MIGLLVVFAPRHVERAATTVPLSIGNNTYHLEVATTSQAQEIGLGGRMVMDKDRGMLFSYSDEDQRCFWMKDMRFPLDIIWVDSTKRITRVEYNLAPGSYPRTFCVKAKYVIELNARAAKQNDLRVGTVLAF